MRGVLGYVTSVVGGFALGRLLDPARGRRRRAMLRDKVVSARHAAADAADTTARDLRNRTRGLVASVRGRWTRAEAYDRVVAERVGARLGGVVSHPGSIEVQVVDGTATLRGPVLAADVPALMRAVARVRGVRAVDDQLDVHEDAGLVPGLQGAPARRRQCGRFELMQREWSPTARLLTGALGAVAAAWGLPRAGAVGMLTGGTGLVLLGRAASNLELKRLFGLGAGRDAVTIQKTIEVAAPVEDVWELWSRYEDFPRFMSHVREVRRVSDGSAHWTVAGPAGLPIQWQTVETRRVAYECLAWKTVAGAPVAHSASAGSRRPAQRQKASASYQFTCTTGCQGSSGTGTPNRQRSHRRWPSRSQKSAPRTSSRARGPLPAQGGVVYDVTGKQGAWRAPAMSWRGATRQVSDLHGSHPAHALAHLGVVAITHPVRDARVAVGRDLPQKGWLVLGGAPRAHDDHGGRAKGVSRSFGTSAWR